MGDFLPKVVSKGAPPIYRAVRIFALLTLAAAAAATAASAQLVPALSPAQLPPLPPGQILPPPTPTGPLEWLAETPGQGTTVSAQAGQELRLTISARAPLPLVVISITGRGLPKNARFAVTRGNPATATLTWTPTAAQASTWHLGFSASAAGVTTIWRDFYVRVGVPPAPVKPQPVLPALNRPQALSDVNGTSKWAFVVRPAVVRTRPSRSAGVVARLGTRTPERTQNLVVLLESVRTRAGTWLHVRLPILPNNRTGWVLRGALSSYRGVRTHLVVDRRALSATLFRDGKPIFVTRVGVGQPRWPTPRGSFYIRNRLVGFVSPAYGPLAFGTSARSPVLTDWPGGGFIGIHGTNQPGLIPGRVSHGCIRMRNAAILRLRTLMPVGTPLTIK